MTAIVVGFSHRSAPVEVLDAAALSLAAARDLAREVVRSPYVAESLVVATCNRVEVYADVTKFHGGVTDVTDALVKATGLTRDALTPHVYVRYDDRAVQHLFDVTAGLDSMVVGEQQILGQVRTALRIAQDDATAGRVINDLAQSALRVGKRVHSETGIDRAGASIVSIALTTATQVLGDLAGSRVLVVGAGAMSSLAVSMLAKAGVDDLLIANRTPANAKRLAASVGATPVPLESVSGVLSDVDLVVSCTGATGVVLSAQAVATARVSTSKPLVVIDLALPHDTDPAIARLPGVTRIDLAALATHPDASAPESEVAAARALIELELTTYLSAQAVQLVEPIVVSLRARAEDVVIAEMQRLRLRLPAMTDHDVDEVTRSLRRSVAALLHTPTIRMKQFAGDPEGERYAATLQRLFDLDAESLATVSEADSTAGEQR